MGVRALIQQYTVPPGAVPSLSPENTGNKAQRSSSSASAHSKYTCVICALVY